eukprot:3841566-Amphidinium_carterae.1
MDGPEAAVPGVDLATIYAPGVAVPGAATACHSSGQPKFDGNYLCELALSIIWGYACMSNNLGRDSTASVEKVI